MGQMDIFIRSVASVQDEMGLPSINWDAEPSQFVRLARAMVQTYQALASRANGEIIETPAAPVPFAPTTTAAPVTMLSDMVPPWSTRTKATENAISRTERALGLLESSGLAKPLAQLTKRDGATVQEWP